MSKLKALLWKELLESSRFLKIYAIIATISVIVMQIIVIKDFLLSEIEIISKIKIISNNLIFLAPMVIPYAGTTVLQKSIVEERREKSLNILLAKGLSPQLIWFSKFISATLFSYALYLITFFIYILIIKFGFNISNFINIRFLFDTLIVMPVISVSLLGVMGLLFWIFKNPQIVALIIPMITLLGSMNFMMKYSTSTINYYTIIGIFIFSVVLILIILISISKISKEYITNL